MTPSRRGVVAGIGASLFSPTLVRAANGSAELRRTLDAITVGSDPGVGLARLAPFDAANLPPPARLDLVTARAGLAIDAVLARRFAFGRTGKGPYRVTPLAGAWTRGAKAVPAAIDADTATIRADAGSGAVLPRAALDRTIAAIEGARVNASPEVAAALGRQVAVLAALRASAPLPGIGRLRDGHDYYTLLLRRSFGDDADPSRAVERLEAELGKLQARADRLLTRTGLRRGSIGMRYSALWRSERWLYPDDDAGRERAVADMNRTLAIARSRVTRLVGPVPAHCLDVTARRMSPVDEAAGRGGYRDIPVPGRPGAYFVDLKDISRRPSWTLPSVVHHELLPGHMVQLPIEAAADPHPLRLEYASAFAEGWAIHAEQIAAADGAYDGDVMGELGHVHWLLFRVCRAIVDLKIHLGGWSVERARAALVDWMGEPAYFAPFDTDLARIVIEPAGRAAEALCWLSLADLADRAPDRPRFHRAVLTDGRKRDEELHRLVEARRARSG